MKRAAILVLALLAVACSEDTAAPTAEGEQAAGEVLGGAISDAMIPLEQLESEAPLAPRAVRSARDVDADQPSASPAEEVEAGANEPQDEGAEAALSAPTPDPDPAG